MSSGKMLITTQPLVQHMEKVAALHLRRQIEACRRLRPHEEFIDSLAGGGVAAITKADYTRKLNHTTGFGMDGPVTSIDLALIQSISTRKGVTPEIDLCSLAHPTALQVLTSSCWTVNGFLNAYAYALHDLDYSASGVTSDIQIHKAQEDQMEDFVRSSVQGFKDGGRPLDLLCLLAESAANRKDTTIYLATQNGVIIGSGGMAVIDTDIGPIAHLYIDSTLPSWRGRGVHAALIHARIQDARECGCVLATLETRPGSGSSRNAERMGFKLAYTKSTFTPSSRE